MRYLALFIAVVTLIGCKKDDDIDHLEMIVGDSVGMMTKQQDTIVQAPQIWNGQPVYPWVYCAIDVDQDGLNDIRFTSHTDTTWTLAGTQNVTYYVSCNSLKEQFQIAAIPYSGLQYLVESDSQDYYGTFPRTIYRKFWYCEEVAGSVVPPSIPYYQNTALAFSEGDHIFENLFWFEHYSKELVLYRNAHEDMWCEFSGGGDSLICYDDIIPEQCRSIPFDKSFYLVFKKNTNPVKYGWIEMKISDTNKLEIFRSGIQI